MSTSSSACPPACALYSGQVTDQRLVNTLQHREVICPNVMRSLPCEYSGKAVKMTYLIHDVSADELTDGHEGLGPFLISVPGAHFHWDSSAASNFLDILQTIRKMSRHYRHFC